MGRLLDLMEGIELKPLGDLTAQESNHILAIRNQPEVRKNMYTDHEISLAEHNAWLEKSLERDDTQMFAVIYQKTVLGAISLTAIAPAHSRAEWAFYLTREAPIKGLGSALEFKFLDWVFGERGLHKLNCEVLAFNTAVVALHKKFGFREEGVRRHHIYRDGEWIDSVLLGLTVTEWREQRDILRERLFK